MYKSFELEQNLEQAEPPAKPSEFIEVSISYIELYLLYWALRRWIVFLEQIIWLKLN